MSDEDAGNEQDAGKQQDAGDQQQQDAGNKNESSEDKGKSESFMPFSSKKEESKPKDGEDDSTPENKGGDDSSSDDEGDKGKGDDLTFAPEAYSPWEIEGMEISDQDANEFSEIVRGLNGGKGLNQEDAQALINLEATRTMRGIEAQREAQDDQAKKWQGESLKDSEFGGEKFEENMQRVRTTVVSIFGDDEEGLARFDALVDQTGIGNHPDFIRAFHRFGIAYDPESGQLPDGSKHLGKKRDDKPMSERMYGSMNNA